MARLQALAQPCRAFRPVEAHLAAYAARRPRKQKRRKARRLCVGRCFQQRPDVVHLDPRVDARADAAQEKPGRGQRVGTERTRSGIGQGSIAFRERPGGNIAHPAPFLLNLQSCQLLSLSSKSSMRFLLDDVEYAFAWKG
nr:hypothetical protein [Mesorhizobium sp.]